MPEKELREKYGGKLHKAINRAIRAELPDGHETLDRLTALAGPARHSGWTTHNGEPTPEAQAYYDQKKKVLVMENRIRQAYGIPEVDAEAVDQPSGASKKSRKHRGNRRS